MTVLLAVCILLVALLTLNHLEARLAGTSWCATVACCWFSTWGIVWVLIQGPFGSGTDERIYHRQALQVLLSLKGDTALAPNLDAGKEGWPRLLGLLYWVGGEQPMIGIAWNVAMTAAACVLSYIAACLYFHRPPTPAAVLVMLLNPAFLVLGPSLLREAICWALLAMLVLAASFFWLGRSWLATTLAAGSLLGLSAVRTPLAALVAAVIVVAAVAAGVFRKRLSSTGVVVLVVAGVLALAVVITRLAGALGVDSEQIATNRQYLSESATTGFEAGSLTGLSFVQTVGRLVIGPIPTEVGRSSVWMWVVVNSLYWLAVLAIVLMRGQRAIRSPFGAFCVFLSSGVLVGMGIVLTNYGIVVRLRASSVVILLPLVLDTVGTRRESRAPARIGG